MSPTRGRWLLVDIPAMLPINHFELNQDDLRILFAFWEDPAPPNSVIKTGGSGNFVITSGLQSKIRRNQVTVPLSLGEGLNYNFPSVFSWQAK